MGVKERPRRSDTSFANSKSALQRKEGGGGRHGVRPKPSSSALRF